MSEDRRILEQRARLLAKPRDAAREEHMLASFERMGVQYAIERKYVFEVARAPRPTALPRSEPHWLGVTSLHGELIAVADLAVLLGAGAAVSHSDDDTLLIVLGEEKRELAIEVDAVLEPRRADIARTRPQADAASLLIEGVTEDGLRLVRGDLLLADPRLNVNSTSNEA